MVKYYVADAINWMKSNQKIGSIVTSLPDAQEIGMDMTNWREWFIKAVGLCLSVTARGCPAVFYQTDRKTGGRLESKCSLVIGAAQEKGRIVLWHKIVLRRAPGMIDLHRPGFTHLIALGDTDCKPGTSTADVIDRGRMIYPNAMGLNAAKVAVSFVMKSSNVVVDPFCGRGTVPAVAAAMGSHSIGVDIDPEQIRHAERLNISLKMS